MIFDNFPVLYKFFRFIVTATGSQGYISGGSITFDDKMIDHYNSFDVDTGIYKAPETGTYLFFFNSLATNSGFVSVYVNDRMVYKFTEYDKSHYGCSGFVCGNTHSHNFMFSTKLDEGDELWLYNQQVIYDKDQYLFNVENQPMTFVGYKTS